MWNAVIDGAMPDYWPPRPNPIWSAVFKPFRRWYLHRYYRVSEVQADDVAELPKRFDPEDGVLLAPNHSHDSDPHVMMEIGRRIGRRIHFMAAWQIFRTHWGIDGWVLQRMGAFSVDREGCDRRAIRQATEILRGGKSLVVFPEGEIYHLNERLTPLLEGVAFMALTAQREMEQAKLQGKVWIVPTAIRYRYLDDVQPKLEAAIRKLEERMLLKPAPNILLHERILRLGEILLTIKEKEKLGHSCENDGDLPTRIHRLVDSLLTRLENEHLKKSPSAATVPLRVKALRRHLLEQWTADATDATTRGKARAGLDDVQLALQAYSYPGDYLAEKPTLERMAETVEKFEEDLYGFARPKGKRRARVLFGEPINLKDRLGQGRPRTIAADVTTQLEEVIQDLMNREK